MTTKSKAQEKHRISEIDENISKLFDIRKVKYSIRVWGDNA